MILIMSVSPLGTVGCEGYIVVIVRDILSNIIRCYSYDTSV
jgi:hypothetical protein